MWTKRCNRELRDQHFLPFPHHSTELPVITAPAASHHTERWRCCFSASAALLNTKSLRFKVYLAFIQCPVWLSFTQADLSLQQELFGWSCSAHLPFSISPNTKFHSTRQYALKSNIKATQINSSNWHNSSVCQLLILFLIYSTVKSLIKGGMCSVKSVITQKTQTTQAHVSA